MSLFTCNKAEWPETISKIGDLHVEASAMKESWANLECKIDTAKDRKQTTQRQRGRRRRRCEQSSQQRGFPSRCKPSFFNDDIDGPSDGPPQIPSLSSRLTTARTRQRCRCRCRPRRLLLPCRRSLPQHGVGAAPVGARRRRRGGRHFHSHHSRHN